MGKGGHSGALYKGEGVRLTGGGLNPSSSVFTVTDRQFLISHETRQT